VRSLHRVRSAGATGALAFALTFALTSVGGEARVEARSALIVPYPIADVWPATVRFLRVDQSYAIKEKDEPAGYLLFELVEGKRSYRAALELVRTNDGDGRVATQLVCTMNDLPHRYETTLLDKLSAKVRDERGPPPPVPRKPPPKDKDAKGEQKPEQKPSGGSGNLDINDLPRPPTLELPSH
jgi:hypothetical protein